MHIALALHPSLMPAFLTEQDAARLRSCGEVVALEDPTDLSSASSRLALERAEIVVTGWQTGLIDASVLDSAPHLRGVAHTAGSVRAYIDPIVFDRGIAVSSQVETNAQPVAEYTLAMILLAGKRAFRISRAYHDRREHVDQIAALSGAGNAGGRVGIVGASRTGRQVIELLRPFDLVVSVYDPFLTDDEAELLGVRASTLEDVMSASDVVSIHAPLLESTEGMISAELLAAMPDGATLINTARGAVIDQRALIAELRSGRIDAILDVTDPEVLPHDSPLWILPNAFITPHIAGSGGRELFRLGARTVDEVEWFAKTGGFRHPVSSALEISA